MIRIKFGRSEKNVADYYIAKGETIPHLGLLEIDEQQLTPEQRQLLLDYQNNVGRLNLSIRKITFEPASAEQLKGAWGLLDAQKEMVEYDVDPTLEQVLMDIKSYLDESTRITPLLEEQKARWEIIQAEKRAEREAEQQAKEAARLAAKKAATIIPWREDGKAIFNLYQGVRLVSGLEFDTRFQSWITALKSVDTTRSDGYMYRGDLLHNRTVELVKGEQQHFLVAATSGSRKYSTTHYRVVTLNAEGILVLTDIRADSSEGGWALRIRDQVVGLLGTDGTVPVAEPTQPEVDKTGVTSAEQALVQAVMAIYRHSNTALPPNVEEACAVLDTEYIKIEALDRIE